MPNLEYTSGNGERVVEKWPEYLSLEEKEQLTQRKVDLLKSGIRFNEQLLKDYENEGLKKRIDAMMKNSEGYDSVFFLDINARYLASIFSKLYPTYYPETKTPSIRFIRVGRDHVDQALWASSPAGRRSFEIMLGELTDVKSIERTFGEENTKQLIERLRIGQGEKRLIIDDVKDRGRTSDLAKKIFEVIDPSSFYSTYFFTNNTDSLPWYRRMVAHRVERSNTWETGLIGFNFCLGKSKKHSLKELLDETSEPSQFYSENIIRAYDEILARRTLSSIALGIIGEKNTAKIKV
jgi:hypothetical protein